MGKARKVLKVASVGAATTVYGLSAYAAFKGKPELVKDRDRREVVIAAALMTGLTWIAALA